MKRDAYASAYVHMRRGISSPLHAAARILDDRPSPDQLRTYLIDFPYLNQKTYQDVRISYSLEHKHSKK